MYSAPIILVADDDEGHALLVRENLEEAGVTNEIRHFKDGQAILDFLFGHESGARIEGGQFYVLLLDIRMPRIDGLEVLRRVKQDEELKKLPIIMLTTTDDPREIERCYALGCGAYVQKPVNYRRFVEVVQQLASLIKAIPVPPAKKHPQLQPWTLPPQRHD